MPATEAVIDMRRRGDCAPLLTMDILIMIHYSAKLCMIFSCLNRIFLYAGSMMH